EVAKAAWDAVHGERLHTTVGKTAKRLNFAKRWMPGSVRKQQRASAGILGK
ncbi:MAG: short-chain dehydrogenase, partial [Erythrobacteraceae bacterium]|nr:short-chain dehydrogenase [Erythrobacteraceae bacterium]